VDGVQRVAALRWHDAAVQKAAGIGDCFVLAVGVKAHPGAAQADRLAVRFGIANDPNLRQAGQVEV
jgi:hypothetical protein